MNTSLIALPAALFYIAGGLSTGLRLFAPSGARRPPRALGIGLGFTGVVLHALVLLHGLSTDAGINLSFFNAMSLSAWLVVLLLLISSLRRPVENLAILLLPVAALTIALAVRYPAVRLLAPDAPLGLKLHVLVSLLAYSLLALASVQAILLAVQDAKLRHHHPGGFVRALPPLQTMESLLFQMISMGFVLLGLALISGFVFLEDMFAQHLAHKTVLSIASWLVFGVLLWGRYRFGWRGRIAIRWTLAGFAVLALAYFGSKAVVELILNA
jgi:ABC-type uncharacterized transport system permease subunit